MPRIGFFHGDIPQHKIDNIQLSAPKIEKKLPFNASSSSFLPTASGLKSPPPPQISLVISGFDFCSLVNPGVSENIK
jgi:hypothetical protein